MIALSAVLSAVSMWRYIWSVVQGHSRPNLAGWLLYQIATVCVLIWAYQLGSMGTVILTAIFAISQFIVILLSFRYGFVQFTRAESVYFGISIAVLIFWIVGQFYPEIPNALGISERGLSLILISTNVFIEIMGALAIFTKLYYHPWSEDVHAWLLAWLGGLFGVIWAHSSAFEDLIYPIYLFTTNIAIWLLCFRKKPKRRFYWLFGYVEKIVWKNWRE